MQINRQRFIPPSDFTDPELGSLPAPVRVTMAGLRLYVDDWGRAELRLRKMLAEIFEHDESVTTEDLEEHLLILDSVQWLRLYADRRGRTLFQIRVWPAVQHPDLDGPRLEPPPGFMKPSRRSQETFTVEERGSERGSASESARAGGERPSRTTYHDDALGAPEPPSPFCSVHQPFGTEEKCGPCGTARVSREIWEKAAASTALPHPAARRTSAGDPDEYVEYMTADGRIETT